MGGMHFYKTKTDHTDWIAELHVLYSTVAKKQRQLQCERGFRKVLKVGDQITEQLLQQRHIPTGDVGSPDI